MSVAVDNESAPNRCPLCGDTFRDPGGLASHINSERAEIRNYIVQLIKKTHPKWVAMDGSCPKCWTYYRNL